MPSEDTIPELREKIERAAPGPWHVYGDTDDWPWIEAEHVSIVIYGEPDKDECGVRGREGQNELQEAKANAALIVAAVNALPSLLDRLTAAEARNRVLEEALKPFAAIADAVEQTDKRDGEIVHRQMIGSQRFELTKSHFRAARNALRTDEGERA